MQGESFLAGNPYTSNLKRSLIVFALTLYDLALFLAAYKTSS